jgi:outer membrane protein TolC
MKSILISLLIFGCAFLQAQNIDYNRIIVPDGATQISFEERLIQMAWKNHPSNLAVLDDVKNSKLLYKGENWSWLNDIYAVGNLNEFTLNPNLGDASRASFYPRYNFGIRLSLGTFFLTPIKSKVALNNIGISNLRVDEKKLDVRRNMLSLLEQFKEQYKVLRIRSKLAEDLLIMYKGAEKEFALGKISIDQFRDASQSYYLRVEDVIKSQSQFLQRKLEIEEQTGILMDEIAGYDDFLKDLLNDIAN